MSFEPATPATEDELVELVREAGVAGHALATEGGGTKRSFGPAAPAGAQVVSLARLSRVVAHEPGDMILSVEAGARLADVQRALAAHDQWLPLDPPFAGASTIARWCAAVRRCWPTPAHCWMRAAFGCHRTSANPATTSSSAHSSSAKIASLPARRR